MRDLVVVSYGGTNINDGTNYTAGFSTGQEWGLPSVAVRAVKRSGAWPVAGSLDRPAPIFNIAIRIVGANIRALRDQLLRLFDPESETPRRLVVRDVSGSNERYVETLCERIQPLQVGNNASVDTFIATLVVVNDPRWLATSFSGGMWTITTSSQTFTVSNTGTDDAYPILDIFAYQPKNGGYAYRRFALVAWQSANASVDYPVALILNTQALISAGKMRADGNDLRVVIDGIEVDRWVSDINTANTKIWFLSSFQPHVMMTLKTAIPSSGTIFSIEVNENIERMPEQGILLIDNEAFSYNSRVISERRFTNIVRAVKGTAMAAHSVNTRVHWVQREICLVYGNASASAPQINAARAPAFSISASSNSSWVYEQFGDIGEQRAGRWTRRGTLILAGQGGCYSATQRGGITSPYEVAGAWISEQHGNEYGWGLYHPCGITGVTWTNGLCRRAGQSFAARCAHWPRGSTWWSWQYILPSPSQVNTWQAWSLSSSFSTSDAIALFLYFYPSDVEVGAATVSLNNNEIPYIFIGNELGNYSFNAVITNQTTNERIAISFAMDLNQSLQIDCYNRTILYYEDRSRPLSALTIPPQQRYWLRFVPGNNTLQFTDSGTTGVILTISFRRRYY